VKKEPGEDPEELADLIEEGTDIDWERTRRLLPEMSTQQLVELMVELDTDVNRRLANELAGRKDALFHLKKLLQDGRNWEGGPDTSHWAPCHAVHILGLVKGEEALRLLLDIVRFRNEELGDCLTEEVPAVLHSFGPGALPSLKELTGDETQRDSARVAGIDAMFALAATAPDQKEEVIAHLRGILGNAEDPFVALMAARALVLLDGSFVGEVMAAYKDGRLDELYMNREEMRELAEGASGDEREEDLARVTRNPLDHFSRKNALELREIDRRWEGAEDDGETVDEVPHEEGAREEEPDGKEADRVRPGEEEKEEPGAGLGAADAHPDRKVPAKNAPCPCGSGKKYKRCCMPRPGRG